MDGCVFYHNMFKLMAELPALSPDQKDLNSISNLKRHVKQHDKHEYKLFISHRT